MKIYSHIFLILVSASTALCQEETHRHELKEIVIQSTPLERSVDELAQSVSVLESEDLQKQSQASLGETLSTQPGMNSSFYGQGASRPIIRGQSGDRIRIMQNGIGVQDASNISPDHAVGLEPIQSERIEVVKGPATLLFGPNAMGGVVNVIDNRIAKELPDKKFTGALDLKGGTVDWQRNGGLKADIQAGENFVFHVDGFQRKADNYRIPGFARSKALRDEGLPDGWTTEPINKRPDSWSEAEGGSLGVSYIFEGGYLGAAVNAFNTDYGLPSNEQGISVEMHQRRFDLRGAFEEPISVIKKIEFKAGVVDYQHRELEGSEQGTVFKNQGIDSRIELTHTEIGSLEGLIGAQYQYSDFSAVGEEAFLKPTQSNIFSGFMFEELDATDFVSFQAGGRLDASGIRNIGYISPGSSNDGVTASNDKVAISGALSTIYRFEEIYAAALSVTHTERAPTGSELFANGPHVGTVAFEVGDPTLGIERSLGLDLSLKKREGHVTGFISSFYNRFNNYISGAPTGEFQEELPVYKFEGFDADFFGAEAQVTAHLFGPSVENDILTGAREISGSTPASATAEHDRNHFDLIGQVDFVRAYDRGGAGDLPRIPPWRLLIATDYQREDFGARAEIQHVFEQENISAFETETDGYTLVNLILTEELKVSDLNSTAFLRLNNIFDEEARSHTSFLKDLTPLPGRNLIAGVRVNF